MGILHEIEMAKRELAQARQDFEWAAGPYVTVATLKLRAAEMKLAELLDQAKQELATV